MSSQVINTDEVTFDQVFSLAQRLRPMDQVRLVARLAPATTVQTRKPLRGLLADLGPAPSAAEIDEVQHEMWATFARE